MAPPGLVYVPDFLSPAEEADLIAAFATIEWQEVRMHGVVARRRVRHYGVDYGYESWSLGPAPPVPGFLEPLRERAARLLHVAPDELAEVLVQKYPPGAGIGWHRDAPMFGPAVVGISLGAPCRLRLRRASERFTLELAPRSAYVLAGAARSMWQHSIPPVRAERWSISLRTVRPGVSVQAAPD